MKKTRLLCAIAMLCMAACWAFAAATQTATILDMARQHSDLRSFIKAVQTAGLDSALESTGPYTVFAPTDTAFNRVPKGTMNRLMQPSNKKELQSLLKYHVVKGNYTLSNLQKMQNGVKLTTLSGKKITVTRRGSDVFVDNVRISGSEIKARNGALYKIGSVLTPAGMKM